MWCSGVWRVDSLGGCLGGSGCTERRDWWTSRADVVSVPFGHSPKAAASLVNPGSAAVAPYGGAASPGFSAHRAGGFQCLRASGWSRVWLDAGS